MCCPMQEHYLEQGCPVHVHYLEQGWYRHYHYLRYTKTASSPVPSPTDVREVSLT
jgi:hypothetical protein